MQRCQTWCFRGRTGLWFVCLFLVSAAPLLASPAEQDASRAIERAVATDSPTRIISDTRAFLRRFPHSPECPRVRFRLAEALYAIQAYQEAAVVYQDILQVTPTLPQKAVVLHHLGLSHLYSHHYSAALAAFAQLLEQFPGAREPQRLVFHMATIYFAQGRFAAALPLYQQLLQAMRPPVSVATLHLQLGHCYFSLQQFASAQHHYSLILQLFPEAAEAPHARYQLGAIALAQQQFAAALQQFQILVHMDLPDPITLQAHYAMAWLFYHQGHVEQAVAYLRQQGLLAQFSPVDVVLAQGHELLLLHAYREAIPLLVPALQFARAEEEEYWLRRLLARAYAGVGEVGQALQTLDDFVRRFPEGARTMEAQRLRGDLLLRQHDAAEALAAYRTAWRLAHDGEQAEQLLLLLAERYRERYALDDAVATWERLLHSYPLSPRRTEVQLRLGAALVQQGAIAQAVALYRRLLETPLPRPDQLQTQLRLAWAYLKGGRHQEALGLYGELLSAAPGAELLRQVRFWRGVLLQRQERYDAAMAEWKALLLLEPPGQRRGEILWRLGSDLMALKRYQEARPYLLQVVTAYPAALYVHLASRQLQQCLFQLQQYHDMLQHTPAFVRHDPVGVFNVAQNFTHAEQLFKARKYPLARWFFQHIIAQPFATPLTDDAAFMIAESYAAEGDAHHALHHYRRVARRYGQTAVAALAQYRAGLLLEEAGQLSAAVQAYQAATHPTAAAKVRSQAWYRLGKAYVGLQQTDKAVAAFRYLLSHYTAFSATDAERLNLGLMLQQLADYDMALQAFRQVLASSQEERFRAEAQFWIAETHQLRQEIDVALTAYQEVASRFPRQQAWALTALFRAGEIHETRHQYREAIAMYQRVVAVNAHDKQGQFAAERVKYLKAKMAKTSAQQG